MLVLSFGSPTRARNSFTIRRMKSLEEASNTRHCSALSAVSELVR